MTRLALWFALLTLLPTHALLPSPVRGDDSDPPLDPAEIPQLIDDLHDDDVRWNALEARRRLIRHGAAAVPLLRTALDSDDYQQRHCAAGTLRHLAARLGLKPTRRLLEVSVEGLQDDHLRGVRSVNNATGGRRFLLQHAEAAYELLAASLESEDRQQRFFAANILAVTGAHERLESVCEILIDHLADNDVFSDAMISCRALFEIGEPAIPFLERRRSSPDRQQREAIELILLDLHDPPRSAKERRARATHHQLSKKYPDPPTAAAVWWDDVGERSGYRQFWDAWKGKTPVPSLATLRERHPEGLTHKFDRRTRDLSIVAIGFIEGKWFDRRLTLRFWPDGTVERRERTSGGQERWTIEFIPW